MKRFLLAFFVIVLLLSINSTVQAQNVNTVQVILKSQNLGLDNNFGVYRANITITANKIGNLTYREALYDTDYSSGTAGEQTLYLINSYNVVMEDYTVSFPVSRPGTKSGRSYWNSIKATVILDKDVVFETWISQGGTYKSFATGKMTFANDSTIQIGRTRPVVEKKPDIFAIPNTNNNTEKISDTIENGTDKTKQSPMLETSVIIVTILSVYMFTRGRNKGRDNN